MRYSRILLFAAALINILSGPDDKISSVTQCYAAAQAPWQQEFDDLCSKTMEAMNLPLAELHQLIARCDKFQSVINTMDETQRKVYQRRLKMCRDMYVFALESREVNK